MHKPPKLDPRQQCCIFTLACIYTQDTFLLAAQCLLDLEEYVHNLIMGFFMSKIVYFATMRS